MDPEEAREELEALADQLEMAAADANAAQVKDPVDAMQSAVDEVGLAWSGSPIGYHARIYYSGLSRPPHEAMFDRDWGWLPTFSNRTRGAWEVFSEHDVILAIETAAGQPDLSIAETKSSRAIALLEDSKWEASSILTALLNQYPDDHLMRLVEETQAVSAVTREHYERRMLPSGPLISRDTSAISGGPQVAPHQKVDARLLALRDPFEKAADLAAMLRRGARHATRLPTRPRDEQDPRTVFVGHGGSGLWRELKDFLTDRLGLQVDEFSRIPTAGVGTTDRLHEILDSAGIAFLVLTAEDEEADGRLHARLNVVHEVGLFQARLGVRRAIVLLEEGCEEFSNIEGLGQIRFPAGDISAKFEEVRRVREREGFIPSSGPAESVA